MTRCIRLIAALSTLLLAAAASAAWDPAAFSKEDTLEFLTIGPEEGEHWSTVWLVVIDGQVYLRLGSRAAERMEANTTKPIVKVRIAGQEFDRVKAESTPDMAQPVATAMGDKYTSDIFVRFFDHPLTMRLTPE
jgi:hypothetical protein